MANTPSEHSARSSSSAVCYFCSPCSPSSSCPYSRTSWRGCMKSGSRRVFRYSSRYEKTLPNGSFRRRIDLHRAALAHPQRIRTAKDSRSPRDPRRRLLRPEERLPVAHAPPRLPQVADRLSLFQEMAHRRYTWERINSAIRERLRVRLKRDPLSPAPALWIARVAQEHRGGRGGQTLRRGQKGKGP
jgi:hypothetical protein